MSRVTRYRIRYLLLLVLLMAACIWGVRAAGGTNLALVVVAAILFVPGRLHGLLLRPVFRGQRALSQGRPQEAIHHFQDLLETLSVQPWRRFALWLGWSPYTTSLAAMVHNNLGTAYAALGEVEPAQAAWDKALALDHLYPVPYANLAALAASRGDAGTAQSLLAQAKTLGYSGGALDQVTHRVQQLLLALESRGPAL